MSCHQPFDADGAPNRGARGMLSAARAVLEQNEVDLTLFLGDQVYADAPRCLSLFDEGALPLLRSKPAAIRALYHQAYLRSWRLADWQALHALSSTACLPDDHEVVDNWGSDPEHDASDWQKLGQAALDAAFLWQGLRSFPEKLSSFCQDFRFNNAGVFMLDVRSQRRPGDGGQVIDLAQMEALARFLEETVALPVLFLGVPVPLVHVPEWVSSIGHALPLVPGDLDDRWSNPVWVQTRDEILRLLSRHREGHPQQKLVVLSGDIHAGWAIRLFDPERKGVDVLQLVSSAITNGDSGLVGTLSEVLLRVSRTLAGKVASLQICHIPGTEEHQGNPYGGLNLGLVDVEKTGTGVSLRFRLVGHGNDDENETLKVVFDSGPL